MKASEGDASIEYAPTSPASEPQDSDGMSALYDSLSEEEKKMLQYRLLNFSTKKAIAMAFGFDPNGPFNPEIVQACYNVNDMTKRCLAPAFEAKTLTGVPTPSNLPGPSKTLTGVPTPSNLPGPSNYTSVPTTERPGDVTRIPIAVP